MDAAGGAPRKIGRLPTLGAPAARTPASTGAEDAYGPSAQRAIRTPRSTDASLRLELDDTLGESPLQAGGLRDLATHRMSVTPPRELERRRSGRAPTLSPAARMPTTRRAAPSPLAAPDSAGESDEGEYVPSGSESSSSASMDVDDASDTVPEPADVLETSFSAASPPASRRTSLRAHPQATPHHDARAPAVAPTPRSATASVRRTTPASAAPPHEDAYYAGIDFDKITDPFTDTRRAFMRGKTRELPAQRTLPMAPAKEERDATPPPPAEPSPQRRQLAQATSPPPAPSSPAHGAASSARAALSPRRATTSTASMQSAPRRRASPPLSHPEPPTAPYGATTAPRRSDYGARASLPQPPARASLAATVDRPSPRRADREPLWQAHAGASSLYETQARRTDTIARTPRAAGPATPAPLSRSPPAPAAGPEGAWPPTAAQDDDKPLPSASPIAESAPARAPRTALMPQPRAALRASVAEPELDADTLPATEPVHSTPLPRDVLRRRLNPDVSQPPAAARTIQAESPRLAPRRAARAEAPASSVDTADRRAPAAAPTRSNRLLTEELLKWKKRCAELEDEIDAWQDRWDHARGDVHDRLSAHESLSAELEAQRKGRESDRRAMRQRVRVLEAHMADTKLEYDSRYWRLLTSSPDASGSDAEQVRLIVLENEVTKLHAQLDEARRHRRLTDEHLRFLTGLQQWRARQHDSALAAESRRLAARIEALEQQCAHEAAARQRAEAALAAAHAALGQRAGAVSSVQDPGAPRPARASFPALEPGPGVSTSVAAPVPGSSAAHKPRQALDSELPTAAASAAPARHDAPAPRTSLPRQPTPDTGLSPSPILASPPLGAGAPPPAASPSLPTPVGVAPSALVRGAPAAEATPPPAASAPGLRPGLTPMWQRTAVSAADLDVESTPMLEPKPRTADAAQPAESPAVRKKKRKILGHAHASAQFFQLHEAGEGLSPPYDVGADLASLPLP